MLNKMSLISFSYYKILKVAIIRFLYLKFQILKYNVHMTKNNIFSFFESLFFISVAIFLASFGLKGFILPNNFIDGGITGVSILLSLLFKTHISYFIIIVNIPFIILAWFNIGRKFAIYTLFSILGLSISLSIFNFQIITDDKLLSAFFGGILLGAGIGLAIRGQSTLDGTEILALLLSKKTSFTVGNIITILNILIFLTSIKIIGVEACLYSILTYLSASKTVDFILYGFENYYTVTIISKKHEEIVSEIYKKMNRGVTLYDGQGGFNKNNYKIINCVITRFESIKIKNIISNIDSRAFVIFHSIKEVHGGLTKKRFMKNI